MYKLEMKNSSPHQNAIHKSLEFSPQSQLFSSPWNELEGRDYNGRKAMKMIPTENAIL